MARSARGWSAAALAALAVAGLAAGMRATDGRSRDAAERKRSPTRVAYETSGGPWRDRPAPDEGASEPSAPPADDSDPLAAAPAPRGEPLPESLAAEIGDALEDALRQSDRAIEASRRLAEAWATDPLPPSPPAGTAAPFAPRPGSLAVSCGASGADCLSEADCCDGLVCAGGVAGYGTRGRCRAAP